MTSMEEEARKRKERLALLRNKRNLGPSTADADSTEPERKKAAFRSYDPIAEGLKADDADTNLNVAPAAVEPQIEEHLAKSKETRVVEQIDLPTLAPRKVDWDLKRDISKKMDKLERRTQRAIADLIRERLISKDDNQTLLASAVNSQSAAAEVQHMSDSDSEDD